ncbi:MAG: hypothetical protein Unbinned4026contig1001_17 [Prokaryotic dsDNA virus sp.]|nr:MAG: hypothetical protein Unbinned4026contig1001_17 [Prokaryotic dsDNA virus sp.]|tara:strand:- start:409 stop:855 length:447 start_codon:yes stop_codon:yes gene_type:complete
MVGNVMSDWSIEDPRVVTILKQIVQEKTASQRETGIRWMEALGPMVGVVVAIAVAYGSFSNQLETMSEDISKLEDLPLQIADLRAENTALISNSRIDQNKYLNELAQRISQMEQKSQVNYEKINRLFDIARANESKINSMYRDNGESP